MLPVWLVESGEGIERGRGVRVPVAHHFLTWNPVKELKDAKHVLQHQTELEWNPVKELKDMQDLPACGCQGLWNPVKELKDGY